MDTEGLFSIILIAVGVFLLAGFLIMNRRDKKEFEKRLNKQDESKAHPAKEEEEKV